MKRTQTYCLFFLIFFLCFGISSNLQAQSWKRVAQRGVRDRWYVDQILAYSTRGVVTNARAYVKCIPGKESGIAREAKDGIAQTGASNVDQSKYFIETAQVDCKKKLFYVSEINFYDNEDKKIGGETYSSPKQYDVTPGSVYEQIRRELCLSKTSLMDNALNTLKTKKPFLYLFPKGETAK